MTTYTISPAGLAHIAAQATELTGALHTPDCAAVRAMAAAAEDSAYANDSADAAQVELRAHTTLSRRPEIISLYAEHVNIRASSSVRYNVYQDIDGACEFAGTISADERAAKIAAMTNVDGPSVPAPYAYRDAHGIVWGFAATITQDELAARCQCRLSPAELAQQDADIAALLSS